MNLLTKIKFSRNYCRYTKYEIRKLKKLNLFKFFKNSKKRLQNIVK